MLLLAGIAPRITGLAASELPQYVRLPLPFVDIPVYGNREQFPSFYATAEQVIDGIQGPLIMLNTNA